MSDVSTQSLGLDTGGWAVNATSSDAIDGVQIEAAPGTGKRLVLQEVHLSVGQSARAIIDSRASATATVTRMLGPITLNAASNNMQLHLTRGIQANVNEAIYLTSSANAFVSVFASGVIKT